MQKRRVEKNGKSWELEVSLCVTDPKTQWEV